MTMNCGRREVRQRRKSKDKKRRPGTWAPRAITDTKDLKQDTPRRPGVELSVTPGAEGYAEEAGDYAEEAEGSAEGHPLTGTTSRGRSGSSEANKGSKGQDEGIKTAARIRAELQAKVKTRNETKAFLGRATGCNLDHIEAERVYSKYAWTTARPYGA
jgi:hypothetical protein